jgi:chemotaxis-related protein WspD
VTATVPVPVPLVAFCWNRIGVNGDRSCPELPKVTHCRNCPVFATGGNLLFDRPPPAGYADEWADRIARPDAPPAGRTVPVVLFRVAGEWLALDVAFAVEAAPVPVVRRVPHQRDRVLAGLVNIRGELLPAVSLRDLLGAGDGDPATADPAKRRLLVAERDGVRWAFVADEVFDVRHLPEADLGAVPGTVKAGATFTRGVFRWDDRAVGYLDPDRLFGALKRSFR